MDEFRKRANRNIISIKSMLTDCEKYFDIYTANDSDKLLMDKMKMISSIADTYPTITNLNNTIIQVNSAEWYKIKEYKLSEMNADEQLEYS